MGQRRRYLLPNTPPSPPGSPNVAPDARDEPRPGACYGYSDRRAPVSKARPPLARGARRALARRTAASTATTRQPTRHGRPRHPHCLSVPAPPSLTDTGADPRTGLPQGPGLLPGWILIVALTAVFNSAQAYATTKLTRRLYSSAPSGDRPGPPSRAHPTDVVPPSQSRPSRRALSRRGHS